MVENKSSLYFLSKTCITQKLHDQHKNPELHIGKGYISRDVNVLQASRENKGYEETNQDLKTVH